MKIGRNAPCPCGSGKKYKACCMKLDRSTATAAGPEPVPPGAIRQAILDAEVWRADLQVLPILFEKEPHSRPVGVMVEAGGMVADVSIVDSPSPESDGVAKVLAESIAKVVEIVGKTPPRVEVRHPEVAVALGPELAARGLELEAVIGDLASMDDPWRSLKSEMAGRDEVISHYMPQKWSALGRPDSWVSDFFTAAAEFYEAAPWRYFDDVPPLFVTPVDGSPWLATVMGSGGIERGLAIYSDPRDFEQLLHAPEGMLPEPEGRNLALTFSEGFEIPPPMRREISKARWKVAGAEAYPVLITQGTHGGGVSEADGAVFLTILRGLVSWVEALEGEEVGVDLESWIDPVSGVRFLGPGTGEVPESEPLRFKGLVPGDPQGAGAQPEATLGRAARGESEILEIHRAWVERFARFLESEGYAASTIERHVQGASTFLRYLEDVVGVPVEAVHFADLLIFLFGFYPSRVVGGSTDASRLIAGLKRFFQFLDREASIECPWAAELLGQKSRFLATWGVTSGQNFEVDPAQVVDLGFELERRVLLPPRDLGIGLDPEDFAGEAERRLTDLACYHWRLWRDSAIREGEMDADSLRSELARKLGRWMESPQPEADGQTPHAAILAERSAETGP